MDVVHQTVVYIMRHKKIVQIHHVHLNAVKMCLHDKDETIKLIFCGLVVFFFLWF